MDPLGSHSRPSSSVWTLARRQYGVVSCAQLLECGVSRDGIKHRARKGRLHRVGRGVYAVGRPELSREGRWMAAVLSCGDGAVLSHESAAALWGLESRERVITLSIPSPRQLRRKDVKVHRVELRPQDLRKHRGIPVTSPTRTLIDLAGRASQARIERAVNVADRDNLIDPERLRAAIAERPGLRGVPALRGLLDRRTFVLTDSELERRFLPLAKRAGLPLPETGMLLNGFKVDFYWRELGLVVETDGLRYHRTAAQQHRDRERDQAHTAAGLTPLRFTHAQVAYEPEAVLTTLSAVARRLRDRPVVPYG